ncbi:MAG: glycosyltransferase [Nitrososphaerota archaeon]|nr:glycosyltransferase [Nitrososphaerota archaeon]
MVFSIPESGQSDKWTGTLNKLSRLSFIVVSHIAFTGHAQELRNFLIRHVEQLVFIGHPFSYAPNKTSFAQFYRKGTLKTEVHTPYIKTSDFILYLKDFLMTFFFTFKLKKKFHVYVGVDPLNALAGLILKRLGFTQIVIFYVIDYIPVRFKNVFLNNIYRAMDRLCVYNADYTWNLTDAMTYARQKAGIFTECTNQVTVPTGTHPKEIKDNSLVVSVHNMVFLSHLRKGQGIELVLDALPQVVQEIPDFKLLVLGTGPLETYFKKELIKRNMVDNVELLGYIESHDRIEEIVALCRAGIAPYEPDSHSFTWFADPGKPKVYLGCGVPVIITKVPEVASEISRRNAGIVIDYDSQELANSMITIIKNDELYEKYRHNAFKFALELDWNVVFTRALSVL